MKITKKKLENYRHDKKELQELKKKIENVSNIEDDFVFDTVISSRHQIPYNQTTINICGYTDRTERIDNLNALYSRRINKLEQDLLLIEEFIEEIEDSEIKLMIRYRFLNGDSWNKTARKVYGYPCGNTSRMKLERYLEKVF